jgi:hypothetical protein
MASIIIGVSTAQSCLLMSTVRTVFRDDLLAYPMAMFSLLKNKLGYLFLWVILLGYSCIFTIIIILFFVCRVSNGNFD